MQCGGNLRVCHIPIFDMNSSCYDLKTALKEIKMWSDNNPSHLPITILIEPKVAFLNEGTIFHQFSLADAKLLDTDLAEGLGDSLYTPQDMMKGYTSFTQLRETIGSVPLEETLGKVLVIFHPSAVTNDYYAADESLMTQKMFPSVSPDKENALFVLENDPYSENIASLVAQNYIVRTRADSFLFYSNEKREKAVESGAQIISSDYPPSDTATQNNDYIAYLKDRFTIILRGIS
ncbi:hypothetical protein SDC9_113245 [bioreactor metagenome]|uniref:GP-PDE domain-containing protein n=1 Tax=bioreactor metagenome TaxID=1076179 RepID=A0A645BMI2_9ZZZZ